MRDAAIGKVRSVLSTRSKKSVDDPSLTPASVLVLVYAKDGAYCMLLTKRTEEVQHHKGEVSFPGGVRDPEDKNPQDTALREVYEEMGIKPEDVMILGELDDVITRTHFGVHVYVGTIPYPYPFHPNPVEIADVLEIPLSEFLHPRSLREEARWVDGTVAKAYAYAYGEHLVYGATAQIVSQFLEIFPSTSTVSKER